jgi:hypothetical protein
MKEICKRDIDEWDIIYDISPQTNMSKYDITCMYKIITKS